MSQTPDEPYLEEQQEQSPTRELSPESVELLANCSSFLEENNARVSLGLASGKLTIGGRT